MREEIQEYQKALTVIKAIEKTYLDYEDPNGDRIIMGRLARDFLEEKRNEEKCLTLIAKWEAESAAKNAQIVDSCDPIVALEDARELLADIAENKVNGADEAEKWLRVYGWPREQNS